MLRICCCLGSVRSDVVVFKLEGHWFDPGQADNVYRTVLTADLGS